MKKLLLLPENFDIFSKTLKFVLSTILKPSVSYALASSKASRILLIVCLKSEMINLAVKNAKNIGAGHSLFIFLKNTFPINVLNRIKNLSEVTHIYCATANPTEVVVAETEQGRGIMGVIDGGSPVGIEDEKEKKERKEFLRKIGYKSS